jgi:putative PIN family toxin of toxin-antitoxin system
MPARIRHRVIIDTNLWISFLLTSNYSKIDALLTADNVTLLLSEELIEEFVSVAQRPKFKKYFSLDDLEDLLTTLKTKAEFIAVNSTLSICRDPKDNFLLSLAKDGKASHLLTGDNDLLVLKKVGRTKILTISEYFSKQ